MKKTRKFLAVMLVMIILVSTTLIGVSAVSLSIIGIGSESGCGCSCHRCPGSIHVIPCCGMGIVYIKQSVNLFAY
jgi:hypothetical protein